MATMIALILSNVPALLLTVALLVPLVRHGRALTADVGLQFEVGIADLAMGVVAGLAFWQGRPFKAAISIALAIALIGDALGHVYQMMSTGNFAPGNAGSIFWWDIVAPLIALGLLAWARRSGPARPE